MRARATQSGHDYVTCALCVILTVHVDGDRFGNRKIRVGRLANQGLVKQVACDG